jgi:hypothetical protein
MRCARMVMFASLRILATVLVLSWMIGVLVVTVGMVASFSTGTVANPKAMAEMLSRCLIAASCGFLVFPVGVFLHWMVAKRTGVFPSSARQSLFWGSLFMCVAFPVGTIMGGIAIWLLNTSEILAASGKDRGGNPFQRPSDKIGEFP